MYGRHRHAPASLEQQASSMQQALELTTVLKSYTHSRISRRLVSPGPLIFVHWHCALDWTGAVLTIHKVACGDTQSALPHVTRTAVIPEASPQTMRCTRTALCAAALWLSPHTPPRHAWHVGPGSGMITSVLRPWHVCAAAAPATHRPGQNRFAREALSCAERTPSDMALE